MCTLLDEADEGTYLHPEGKKRVEVGGEENVSQE